MGKVNDIDFRDVLLDKESLKKHIKNFVNKFEYINKSDIRTYPIKRLKEDYKEIREVYKLLNTHIKLGIKIHSAGEWILDNFYIVEEAVKFIQKELKVKEYKKLIGINSGKYQGYPRIYLLAEEIVSCTDSKINEENLEYILKAYSEEMSLSSSEIDCFEVFLKLAIINKIRKTCNRIYISEIQKYKVESLLERTIEIKEKNDYVFTKKFLNINLENGMYPYVEYLSYKLKSLDKTYTKYQEILEKEIEKIGKTIPNIIRKEHMNVARIKNTIGNAITSIKNISRISFSEIYGELNISESNLNKDPSGIYPKMDNKTKEAYRKEIESIARKYKISEKFITENILSLCKENVDENNIKKESHVGYYIISDGKNALYERLGISEKECFKTNEERVKLYISVSIIIPIIISFLISMFISNRISFDNGFGYIIHFIVVTAFWILLVVPISEIVFRIMNYILLKIKKPKVVPKLDFEKEIPEEIKTFVIIPCILSSKEKVEELFRKLEVYYLANKMDNLYFCLLGDSAESIEEKIALDEEVSTIGEKIVNELNKKYKTERFSKFHFLYRNRTYSNSENKYIGWERKRGLIYKFNLYIKNKIPNDFKVNTIELEKDLLPEIKYVITLDSDTNLSLGTAGKLVGSMEHILNLPIIENKKVVSGYGIMQPRTALDFDVFNKSNFTKIYSKQGGTDFYSLAVSDVYQDYFEEGIFTGKGIYNIDVYLEILDGEIPEETVLSHDLLEGAYLRNLNINDVVLLDGYPTKYLSFIFRNHRWVRGDFQIWKWLFSKRLNRLSKFKILDNLRRALIKPMSMILLLFLSIVNLFSLSVRESIFYLIFSLGITSIIISFLLELINNIVFKESIKEGSYYAYKKFSKEITNKTNNLVRIVLEILFLPYEAYKTLDAIIRSIYRMKKKKKLLEWTTSEDTDKLKVDIKSYYKEMKINVIVGFIFAFSRNVIFKLFGILWIIGPFIAYYLSLEEKEDNLEADEELRKYLLEIARKTWAFFENNITENYNYLIPDNYQEDRKEKLVDRTSSTNIGLEIASIISAHDLGFISKEKAINYIKKILNVISVLEKWNGHLYNWYNIKTLKPLNPRYVSTVDSGNFIVYLYILKSFLEENNEKEEYDLLIRITENLIDNTDFSYLYNEKIRLFSIGFDVKSNKLTDSYYDLLASEARQASFVAIAKKDTPIKHWNSMSRTLTNLNGYKGLVSWSGTAFEYLMPNINFKRYKGSLLDESSQFLIKSQIKYAKMLGIPWGISESAYNIKDLNNNYQYKAFGIPWLGLKRGLEDELVISPYSTFLSLEYEGKNAIDNLKEIESIGGVGKYGFYESIDFTKNRLKVDENYAVVKCFMAHHQGLTFLSINNYLNNNILKERFSKNPEIEATNILLEENMPSDVIITKEVKEKLVKQKNVQDSGYICVLANNNYLDYNFISNQTYSLCINNLGESISKYNNKNINVYKENLPVKQGIGILVKNTSSKKIVDVYENALVEFYSDKVIFKKEEGGYRYKLKIYLDPNQNIEIRSLEIENIKSSEENLEIYSYLEPCLTEENEFLAHPIFSKMFMEVWDENDELYILKNNRELSEKTVLGMVMFSEENELDYSFEVDREKFLNRRISKYPYMIEENIPFSNKTVVTKDYILAMKKVYRLEPKEKINVSLILAAGDSKEEIKNMINNIKAKEELKRIYNLSRIRSEEEVRYIGVKTNELEKYRKFISFLYLNKIKETSIKFNINDVWKYGISGDRKILLCEISNPENMYALEEIIDMYDYFRAKKIYIDLVIINNEKYVYEKFLREMIYSNVQNKHLEYLISKDAGIFIINKDEMEEKEYEVLKYLSTCFIDLEKSNIDRYMKENEMLKIVDRSKVESTNISIQNIENIDSLESIKYIKDIKEDLEFFNSSGGFLNDGKEYVWIKKDSLDSVMTNVIGNNKFGIILTDNLGGYVWYKNSRLNKITVWENDISLDVPSELFYFFEKSKNKVWSLNSNVIKLKNEMVIKYGLGYANFIYFENDFETKVDVIVPENKTYKIMKIKMKNYLTEERNISFASFVRLVLGENEQRENNKINIYERDGTLYAENTFESEFINKAFLYSSIPFVNITNSKEEFFGKDKDIMFPKILNKNVDFKEEGTRGLGYKINIDFKAEEIKEFYIVFGVIENEEIDFISNMKNDVFENFDEFRNEIDNKWNGLREMVNINVPSNKINYVINNWFLYQTIQSRLYAKSGYYQSGGANGFRDQLQDAIGIKYYDSNILKEQIIKCASKQFKEGDVLHWWHEQTKKGVRTMFSDDLLWLVFAVYEYVIYENDTSILFEEVEYLEGELLENLNVLEKYDRYYSSLEKEIIFYHLKRAIDLVIKKGIDPFPKIGVGDWNDGFSNIGSKGKGESIWLGFFFCDNLEKFINLYNRIESRLENKIDINYYQEIKENLKKNLNTLGWDARWFKRAITDDGEIIGSINSKECKIDGLSQAWSVISNVADNDKKYIAMEEAENHLIDKENRIIKLFWPGFKNVEYNPGYIKAYPVGVRENGGQYTHAAIWFILAEMLLGFDDKAYEYLEMINPITHSENQERLSRFKLEPYVMYADLYSNMDMVSRGGWIWYTGSSAWYIKIVLEYLLGIKIEDGFIKFLPHIPSFWDNFEISFKYKSSKYNFFVKKKKSFSEPSKRVYINGREHFGNEIKIQNDGKIYNIEFFM